MDMIKLAIDLPQAYIIIKGKDLTALNLPVMADVVKIIDSIPNIAFEIELETYSPYKLAAMADLTIGCQTSLIDEVLSVGKPALIYDRLDFVNSFFGYEKYPVVIQTYEELHERTLCLMTGGIWMDPALFAEMRSDYYSAGNSVKTTPRLQLRNQLDQIYRTQLQCEQ